MVAHPGTGSKYLGGTSMKNIISGVYVITNSQNGHQYIGSTKNFLTRFYDHKKRLESGIHRNKHLQNAWNKYGSKCFSFSIVECCDASKLIEREQFYINTLKPEYNIAKDAQRFGAGLKLSEKRKKEIGQSKVGNQYWLGRHHTAETKEKISKAHKGKSLSDEHKKKIGNRSKGNKFRLGIPHTEEIKKRISNSLLGNKHTLGYVPSEETRQKISNATRGRVDSDETKRKKSEAKKRWWEEKKRAN
jgi:group I intron endonuclease